MKNSDILGKIKDAYAAKSPDVLQSLQFDKVEMDEAKTTPVRKRYFTAAAIYAAACLVLVLTIPFIIGGRNDKPVTPDPGMDPGTETSGEVSNDFDFGGDEFKILYVGEYAEERYDRSDSMIWYDETSPNTPDMISQPVIDRNKYVEGEHNVRITVEEYADPTGEAVSRMKAGQCDFDAIVDEGTASAEAALEGYLYDFHSLDNIDLTKSYWLPGTVNDLTVNGMMFMNGGYITMSPIINAEVLLFDKSTVHTMSFSEPRFELPYDYVYRGTWTYDVFLDMVLSASTNLNGDGTPLYCEGGVFADEVLEAMMSQEPVTVQNSDGSYSVDLSTDKMTGAYQKYITKIRQIEDPVIEATGYGESQDRMAYFNDISRDVLFMQTRYGLMSVVNFNRSSDTVGIVPMPVVNAGDDYVTAIASYGYMVSVPAQVSDTEMAGAVLELLAAESERTLLPVYDDYVLNSTSMTDARDNEMLKVIRAGLTYDWTELYMPETELGRFPMSYLGAGTFPTEDSFTEICQTELDKVIAKLNEVKEEHGFTGQTESYDHEFIMPDITMGNEFEPAPEPEPDETEEPVTYPDELPVCIATPDFEAKKWVETVGGVEVEPLTEKEEAKMNSDMAKFRELFESEVRAISSSDSIYERTFVSLRRNSDYRLFHVSNVDMSYHRNYLMTGGKLYELPISSFSYSSNLAFAAADMNDDGMYELYFARDVGSGVSRVVVIVYDPATGEWKHVSNESGEAASFFFSKVEFSLTDSGELGVIVNDGAEGIANAGIYTLHEDENGNVILKTEEP